MEVFWTLEPGPAGTTYLVVYRADKKTRELRDSKKLQFKTNLTREAALKFVEANYPRGD